jgi:3-oxoacyl-(acyl-carrier-protein) synthase
MGRVIVTGMGIISAAGNGVAENYDSLRQGKSGVGKATHFESVYTASLPFGEVKQSNERLREKLGFQEEPGYTRTDLLALTAMNEAIREAYLTNDQIRSYDTAFISASTVGGMCLTDQLYQDANLRSDGSEYLESYGCAAHTLRLAQHFGIRGYTNTINTACSSSANAIMLGARLIKSGRVKRAIVGGVDSLAKYTINGFNALKILSDNPSKPFDVDRNGLNLGEAAAYLILESEETAVGKKFLAEIAGYGNANDAHHPSAMSDEAIGAVASMQAALQSAGLRTDEIDYVNAHGTGTPNNDQVELEGLKKLFGKVPLFNSTKPFTGHTLGAAGAVEAVFSILSLQHQTVFSAFNVQNPVDPEYPPVSVSVNSELKNVLSNSFGFGGNCTSLVLGKV